MGNEPPEAVRAEDHIAEQAEAARRLSVDCAAPPHLARPGLRIQAKAGCKTDNALRAGTKGGSDKQLSARISRHLRLLHDHGLIHKMPDRRWCSLSGKEWILTASLNTLLAASTRQLMEFAAVQGRFAVSDPGKICQVWSWKNEPLLSYLRGRAKKTKPRISRTGVTACSRVFNRIRQLRRRRPAPRNWMTWQ